jgi:hypothetical protein
MRNFRDYGKLGHAEVVSMKVPAETYGDFARLYFSLFVPFGRDLLDRNDPMDKGPEYRSLVGIPGGTSSPMYPELEKAAAARGFKLVAGRGNEPDTLGRMTVYVMDTKDFPAYQAELYHQFHDDFLSPPYGKAYNGLRDDAVSAGALERTACPESYFDQPVNT